LIIAVQVQAHEERVQVGGFEQGQRRFHRLRCFGTETRATVFRRPGGNGVATSSQLGQIGPARLEIVAAGAEHLHASVRVASGKYLI
jgi:hypothetical protein